MSVNKSAADRGGAPQPKGATTAPSTEFICPHHGPQTNPVWLPCYECMGQGFFDAYEDDPINEAPGAIEICDACDGNEGRPGCPVCNQDNPDAEW